MPRPHGRLPGSSLVIAAAAVALATVGLALAQAPPPEPAKPQAEKTEKAKAKAPAKGGLRAGGGVPPKGLDRGAIATDPLYRSLARGQGQGANRNQPLLAPALPEWPYHFTLRLTGEDGIALAAAYYPSRARENAPVLILVHQTGTGHASRDFEEPIEGLDAATPEGLAQYLQAADFAVLTLDLRGHGGSGLRQELTSRDWTALARDLRTAYLFLIDRHNRQDLNLAKLGVVGVGDGGSLAAHWAISAAGGPVSGPGRVSDLAALVIVSPTAESSGLRLAPALNALAPRAPILLIAGERDAETAKAAQKTVERNRLGQVNLLDTRLQGDVLIRLEPKVAAAISKFLEEPVKFRANATWQPRYLLDPVVISDAVAVDPRKPKDAAKKEEPKKTERPKEEPKKAAPPDEAAKKKPAADTESTPR